MVASHLVWLMRTRGIRQRAKDAGQTFDEFDEGIEWQSQGLDLEKKFLRMFSRTNLPGSRIAGDSSVDTYGTFAGSDNVVPKTVPNATA